MPNHAAEEGMVQAHVEMCRARILDAIERQLRVPVAEPLATDRFDFLCNEAKDLFWNELSWEEITDDERVAGGHFTEMAFPAFLAFVDGLVLEKTRADSLAPARPHPDVVEEILVFLGEQHAEFTTEIEGGADSEHLVRARAMTARLIDLVLCRLYHLTAEEREEIESVE